MLVLDMAMEEVSDPGVLRELSALKGSGRLVLAGIAFPPASELAGLASGASACCPDSWSDDKCVKVLGLVLRGGVWLSNAGLPELVKKLQALSVSKGADQAGGASVVAVEKPTDASRAYQDRQVLGSLTKREREIAELVGRGISNKHIAEQLNISDRTVKAHLTAVFGKFQVTDRLQLALRVSKMQT
jgi:DNA-binding NarL/FixJ family response regulator